MDKELELKFSERRNAGDWQGAFQLAFDALDRSPDDEDATRMVSETLAEHEQVIPSAILDDARLDGFFCHCELCGEPWIPKGGAARGAVPTVSVALKPEGIQCESCGGVFCHRCYIKSGDTISCPRCLSHHVAPATEPNGRNVVTGGHHLKPPERKWWQIWR